MARLRLKIWLGTFLTACFFLLATYSWAITSQECEQKIGREDLSQEDLAACEEIFTDLINQSANQEKNLESEIRRFSNQIALTTTSIVQTIEEIDVLEEQIGGLETKVDRLNLSLDRISALLIRRIEQTYKKGREDVFLLLFSSRNFSQFLERFKYFQVVQAHDKKLLFQMEEARVNYQFQKEVKEEKQKEMEMAKMKLEREKLLLDQQKKDQEKFLVETRGNKVRYQELLKITREEIEAIQRIAAGEGDCAEVGQVSEGERIASVIAGSSACSLGTHLHFEVRENGGVKNPFGYLKSIDLVDDSDGDPHVATGSWNWPLNEPIRLTQGFGDNTSAIRSRIVWYDFHTGIDIVSESLTVKAVKSGSLSQCSISCGGGSLRYVVVDHQDSDLNTYYLHVNY